MRLCELLSESNDSRLKNNLKDLIVLVKAQGLNNITVDQLYELVKKTQTFSNLDLSKDEVMDIVSLIDNIRIEPDVNSGVLTVFVDGGSSNKEPVKDETDEAFVEPTKKSAIRAVRKKLGMSRR